MLSAPPVDLSTVDAQKAKFRTNAPLGLARSRRRVPLQAAATGPAPRSPCRPPPCADRFHSPGRRVDLLRVGPLRRPSRASIAWRGSLIASSPADTIGAYTQPRRSCRQHCCGNAARQGRSQGGEHDGQSDQGRETAARHGAPSQRAYRAGPIVWSGRVRPPPRGQHGSRKRRRHRSAGGPGARDCVRDLQGVEAFERDLGFFFDHGERHTLSRRAFGYHIQPCRANGMATRPRRAVSHAWNSSRPSISRACSADGAANVVALLQSSFGVAPSGPTSHQPLSLRQRVETLRRPKSSRSRVGGDTASSSTPRRISTRGSTVDALADEPP